MTITEKDGVLIDEKNNRASIEYFGSRKKAEAALRSCSDCSDCLDCSGCSGCSDCSGCSRCLDCSGCSGCSDCSGCSRCLDCSDCSPQKVESPQIPKIENIHKRLYECVTKPHALNMNTWHTCDTTHCRAGWIVNLAGDAGKTLEERTSTLFAAQQIYKASGYLISPCRFFDSNEDAMKDMKRLAEAE